MSEIAGYLDQPQTGDLRSVGLGVDFYVPAILRALRRSSSLVDHADAAAGLPVAASTIMLIAVVFPLPRRPAGTNHAGRWYGGMSPG
jgi:hypothetical protein